MPTPVSHAAVGYAIGVWTQRGAPVKRVCVIAAACAALPDIDLLSSPFIAHRGITHSITFALIVALLVAWTQRRAWLAVVFGLALLSHSCLDALTTYSAGIAFFAPFSAERYRFLWTPLGDPAGRLSYQLVQDGLVVLLPALLAVWAGLKVRRET
jgi:inner membrane protein